MVGAAEETLQEVLARLRWRTTQPPKSPLSGGLVTQFLPDKGARGVRNDECWIFAQSLKPHFRDCARNPISSFLRKQEPSKTAKPARVFHQ